MGETKPLAVVGIILSDRRRRQDGVEFGYGVQYGLNEGIRVRAWPRIVITIGAKPVGLDHRTNFRDQPLGGLAVDGEQGFGCGAEPSPVRGKSIDADRVAPGGVIVAAIARRALRSLTTIQLCTAKIPRQRTVRAA